MLLRRAAVAAATLTTLVLASASGLFKEKSVSGNLDADPDIEQVKAERVPDPVDPADDDLAQTAVDVLDTCAGTPIQTRITSVQEALVTLRLVDADTHEGKDVFTDLRSGASGQVGEIRLVSWRPQVGGPVSPRRTSCSSTRAATPRTARRARWRWRTSWPA